MDTAEEEEEKESRCCSIKLSHSSSASCLSTTNHSGRQWTQAAGVEDMTAYTTLLMLGVLGTIQQAATEQNITSNSTAVRIKANERFRRLIPYMTFYFAQQNYDNRPVYQEYSGAAHILPVSNNKLPAVPKYQGNLVVPNTYLLRYTPRKPPPLNPAAYPNTLTHQVTSSPSKLLTPRPFSPTSNGNNNSPQNHNRYVELLPSQAYHTQPITDYVGQNVQQLNTPDFVRPLTVSQILSILQAIQRLPQTVTPHTREPTTPEPINILKQTNQLPTSTVSSLAKILGQIPRYNKVYESLAHPVIQSSRNEPLNGGSPKYVLHANTNNPATTKTLIRTYANNNYASKRPQISTPVKDLVQNIEEYDTYDDEPKLQKPLQDQAVTRPLPLVNTKHPLLRVSTVTPVPSLAQNINELQNYDYSSEVLDNPDNENKTPVTKVSSNDNYPIKKPKTSTSLPDVSQKTAQLKTYAHAGKLPQLKPNYYRGQTTTQIFPAPNAEGGTPGQPGIDYPIYSSIPETSFTCKNQRYKGFFGDPETYCQVWHYCDLNGGQASFLCPNGTIFSQVGLTCDWWFNVRCSSTPQLYVLNERLYKYILPVVPSFPEDFSGPIVDQYLALKFRESENKKKIKENANKTESTIPSKTT